MATICSIKFLKTKKLKQVAPYMALFINFTMREG